MAYNPSTRASRLFRYRCFDCGHLWSKFWNGDQMRRTPNPGEIPIRIKCDSCQGKMMFLGEQKLTKQEARRWNGRKPK